LLRWPEFLLSFLLVVKLRNQRQNLNHLVELLAGLVKLLQVADFLLLPQLVDLPS
jgi:hypothetical protein